MIKNHKNPEPAYATPATTATGLHAACAEHATLMPQTPAVPRDPAPSTRAHATPATTAMESSAPHACRATQIQSIQIQAVLQDPLSSTRAHAAMATTATAPLVTLAFYATPTLLTQVAQLDLPKSIHVCVMLATMAMELPAREALRLALAS